MKVVCCRFNHILSVGFFVISVAESNVSKISWSFFFHASSGRDTTNLALRNDKEMCYLCVYVYLYLYVNVFI